MKNIITITSLLVAGAAFANATPDEWVGWTDYWTWSNANTGGYFSDKTLESFGSSGDFALRVDFSDLAYKSDSTAGSYFIGIKFNEGANGTYCGIRISEDANREAYLFTYGNTQNVNSVERIAASSISGNLSASIEYDSTLDVISVYLGDTLLGTTELSFDWTTTKAFAIGAGSPPENHSANNLSNSFDFAAGTKLYYSVSQIPEPSAFGLLAGLGALALAGTRRRRAKKA